MHFALEPINALAFEKNGIFEIHTGNQWQSAILPVLAKALGRSQDKIVMRSYLLGGAFGRRLDGDYVVPAALAAKTVGSRSRWSARVPTTCASTVRDPPRRRSFVWRGETTIALTAMDHHAAAGWPTALSLLISMPRTSKAFVRSVRHSGRRPLVHGRGAACSRAAK